MLTNHSNNLNLEKFGFQELLICFINQTCFNWIKFNSIHHFKHNFRIVLNIGGASVVN